MTTEAEIEEFMQATAECFEAVADKLDQHGEINSTVLAIIKHLTTQLEQQRKAIHMLTCGKTYEAFQMIQEMKK